MSGSLLTTSTTLLDSSAKLLNQAAPTLTKLLPPQQIGPVVVPGVTTITSGGEKWDITAPADVTVKDPATNGGVLEFDINYTDLSLLNGQAHGIDEIDITPEVNKIANASGFKEPVKFVVTNDMSVPIGGFDLYAFNNTPATGPFDTNDPTGHPNNYAHFHGVAANPFAPETVQTFLPDFITPAGTAPVAQFQATGVMTGGQTVTASAATFHSEEIAGQDNGFGLAFFPIGSPNDQAKITGVAPTETTDGVPPFLPFANAIVTDAGVLPVETATITVKNAAGTLTDADVLSGTDLTHTGVGIYSIVSLPSELTNDLEKLQFKLTGKSDTLTLSVDNSNGLPPVKASTVVTLTPSTSLDGTTVVTNGPQILDAAGNTWAISQGQVTINGTVDPVTHRVVAIGYANGQVWQENADKNWWSKASPTSDWVQGPPPASIANVVLNVSADNTVLTNTNDTIVDSGQNTWTIQNGQVWSNGAVDPVTNNVIELAYEKGVVWQENSDHLWWQKVAGGDDWAPTAGTPTSPVVGVGVTPDLITANIGGSLPTMAFLQPPVVAALATTSLATDAGLPPLAATGTVADFTVPTVAATPDPTIAAPSMLATDPSVPMMMVASH
jgi:hypothetical protein